MHEVLRVATSAGSVSVVGLAERVQGETETPVEAVASVAGSAAAVCGVLVAVVIHGHASPVGVEEPSVGAAKADLVFPVPV